jgi:hypothetical protein
MRLTKLDCGPGDKGGWRFGLVVKELARRMGEMIPNQWRYGSIMQSGDFEWQSKFAQKEMIKQFWLSNQKMRAKYLIPIPVFLIINPLFSKKAYIWLILSSLKLICLVTNFWIRKVQIVDWLIGDWL